MLSINTNPAASSAAFSLNKNNQMLQASLKRLSSGSRIADPTDDAGGLAVSMRLNAQINRTQGAMNNVANALSFVQVQDGALSTVGSIVDRMSELRAYTDDVTKNTSDKDNYNTEFQQLRQQLNNIISEKFNGVSLFSAGGSATFGSTLPSSSQLVVYASEAGNGGTTISLGKLALGSALNIKGVSAGGAGFANGVKTAFAEADNLASSAADADGTASLTAFAVGDMIQALENVATLRAQNGALGSRLGFAADQLALSKSNVEAAKSRIFDVDVASEATALARSQILVQASAAMLSQANASSGLALSVLLG
jgi:flagellin